MLARCAIFFALVGVSLARTPPLDLVKGSPDGPPVMPSIDYGLTGIDMTEQWERYTLKAADNPTIIHPNLNGAVNETVVEGIKMKTIKGREINAFLGLKYGRDTAEYRFQKTQPAGVYWTGDTVDATHLGEKCPQKSMLGHIGSGSEDCLNLNVYTPYLPDEGKDPLPVMMFIHGGAFISGDSSLYMPSKLLDRDVILVVIHYRLGTLGFFCLNDNRAPGNVALWDQIEAMQWIQDNIEGFGGDKTRVTIFGESAGSASVNYHLLLPASRGLFHRVIGESGSALEHWSHDPDPILSAELIGEANGCPSDDHEALYNCMMGKSAYELALKMDEFVVADRKRGEMGFRGAAPVTQVEGLEGTLITKNPEQYFLDADNADVPLMIGANKHEGSFVLGIMYTAFLVPNGYMGNEEYMREQMFADLLNAFGVTDQTHGMSESLSDSYLMDRVDLADFEAAAPGFIDMVSVFFLKAGGWRTAKLHANYSSANAYYYSFDYESDDSMFRWLFMGYEGIPFRPGVTHADDLMYLFSLPADLDTEEQLLVKDRMVRLWTNFATYGDPTPDSDTESWQELNIPKWGSVGEEGRPYMLIQADCTVEHEYPNRWHIAMEEDGPQPTTTNTPQPSTDTPQPSTDTPQPSTDTPQPSTDTPQPSTDTPQPTTTTPLTSHSPEGPTQDEYDALKQESQAYMITMIVFIVASVGLAGLSAFFYKKIN